MEYIKSFIETLVTIIILFSAIELISPNNSMKKYIKFVLGLILIVVMLSPIIDFFTEGEDPYKKKPGSYELEVWHLYIFHGSTVPGNLLCGLLSGRNLFGQF